MHVETGYPLQIDNPMIREAALTLRAVKHPLRQQMLHRIHQHQSVTVTQLYQELNLEQSVASQHLAVLRRAELVQTERRGKHIYYSVNYAQLRHIEFLCGEIVSGCHTVPITRHHYASYELAI